MQFEMFTGMLSGKSRAIPNVNIFDWENALRDKTFASNQADFVTNEAAEDPITTYKSGASAISDIRGYINAGSAIGICVMDTSANARRLIGEYVSLGGKVFADSGAFRAFKATIKTGIPEHIDFCEVLERYHEIIDYCSDASSLIVVAPDVVGDQQQSFELLVEFKREIHILARRGVKVMVPMQKGQLSIDEHYKRCKELLQIDFIVGLPSNAKALSREEVFDFVQNTKPSAVHFLGCSETALVHEAKFKAPSTNFSCDATQLRKHIGKGRLLTEMQTQILEDATLHALHGRAHRAIKVKQQWDESEIDLTDIIKILSVKELNSLSSLSGISADELKNTTEKSELDKLIFERGSYQGVSLYISNYVSKMISPQIRTYTVSELAKLNII